MPVDIRNKQEAYGYYMLWLLERLLLVFHRGSSIQYTIIITVYIYWLLVQRPTVLK